MVVSLLTCHPVVSLAKELKVTPAQILLRWALSQNCVVIPKATSKERMQENANVLNFTLTKEQVKFITDQVQSSVTKAAQQAAVSDDGNNNNNQPSTMEERIYAMGRLCWRNDPLRLLDFE